MDAITSATIAILRRREFVSAMHQHMPANTNIPHSVMPSRRVW